MLIGKAGAAETKIAVASPDRIWVRGRDLTADLMGGATFTDFVYLLATGRAPTEDQRFFLDLSLVALAEHGLTPSVQAARMTLAADPAALQGAVAAGVLGCGTVILGAADLCRALIDDVLARAGAAGSVEAAALEVARDYRAARRPIPGYGHPLHKPVDPRAERMIALARERGVAGRAVEAATALTERDRRSLGQAAADERLDGDRGDAGRRRRSAGADPRRADPRPHGRADRPSHRGAGDADRLLSRLKGRRGDRPFRGRTRLRLMPMVEPDIEAAPWEDQARLDAPLYLKQIEYLFERSRFYRGKLERAGYATHGAVGGLEAIACAAVHREGRTARHAHAG